MPELPDVEVFRKKARKALHNRIKDVSVNVNRIADVSEATLKKHLIKKKFRSSTRHGKYLFFHIKNKKIVMVHFGMTGDVAYWKSEKPEYSGADITFANGYTLSILTKRKLGKIKLIEDMDEALKGIGEDALDVSGKKFAELARRSKAGIKSFLMDQSKIAGIGNIYADEILYQSRIHPKDRRFSDNRISRLYEKMREVLNTAIDANVDESKFPRNYITPHRREGDSVMGNKVKKTVINGRSTYYCPKVQK